jgi:spermidine dehydrogenase
LVASSLAGSLALSARATHAAPEDMCGDVLAKDPRVLRGGNLPSAFMVAHWLRDSRLQFGPRQVTVSAGCDGDFDIADDGAAFDVIIVGGGLSGLSAAFYLLRRRPDTSILVLDANLTPGGNAAHDSGAPLPVVASTAGAYFTAPQLDTEKELYRELQIERDQQKVVDPVYNFFFDENAPGVNPGHRGWNLDTFGKGVHALPYQPKVVSDFVRCHKALVDWFNTDGGPTDPPDSSSPRYDYLSQMSFADYLTNSLHCDPIESDFYTRYTVDCLGGTASQVNAHSAISFLSSDYAGDLFTFPGGTSEIARRLVGWLTNPAGPGRPRRAVQIRSDAVALRADPGGPGQASPSVVYFKDNAFRRAAARTVIVATGSQSAKHLVEHLIDAGRRAQWGSITLAPALAASVAVKSAAPLIDLGLGYDQYWWGSRYWADFIIADWVTANRANRDRATVLTFYGGNTAPKENMAEERLKLLSTPFSAYESSLKDDLSRILAKTSFDFDRDVTSISLYRWGHSMIMPTPGSLFGATHGADGKIDRAKAPRREAYAALGPISFAGQDSEGTPCVESATRSGSRAAQEALAHL